MGVFSVWQEASSRRMKQRPETQPLHSTPLLLLFSSQRQFINTRLTLLLVRQEQQPKLFFIPAPLSLSPRRAHPQLRENWNDLYVALKGQHHHRDGQEWVRPNIERWGRIHSLCTSVEDEPNDVDNGNRDNCQMRAPTHTNTA